MGTGGRVARRRGEMDHDSGDEDYVLDDDQEEDDEEGVDLEYESDADFDGEEDEDGLDDEELEIDTPRPAKVRAPSRKRKPAGSQRRRHDDEDDDYCEEEDGLEDELEIDTPHPTKVRPTSRKRNSAGSQRRRHDDDNDDYYEEETGEEDGLDDKEFEIDTPRPTKVRATSRKRNSAGSRRRRHDDDNDDYCEEEIGEEDGLEDEEFEIDTPRPAKVRATSRKRNSAGSQRRRHDNDNDDYCEEEIGEEDELEDEEFEIDTPRPAKVHATSRKRSSAGSQRRRHDDDDDDYYEEEIEKEDDDDFDPDGNDNDVLDEEEEEDLGTKKVIRPKNHLAKRKTPAGRQYQKKRSGSCSRVSKRKARMGTSARPRRRQRVTDDYEDDEDEDADFVVDDDDVDEEVNYRTRKKVTVGRKTRDDTRTTWPLVESDTSEFEFITSDEESTEKEAPTAHPAKIKGKKGRRKSGSRSDSSSNSEYVISQEELKDLGMRKRSLGTSLQPTPPLPTRRTIVPRRSEEKGKELEEAMKQRCGICLSEEQRATIQGVLNCCSHYFCFACILEWSKVESRCPLCKQRFNKITKSSVVDLGLGSRNAVIRVSKRDQVYQPTEEEMRRWLDPYENITCIECNQGGDDNLMLLCDICDSSAHSFCVGLGRQIPEGNWYCGGCRLSVEGSSYAQTHDRVIHLRESSNNNANSSSSSFGTPISSGVFERPPPINVQPSLGEFDLNLSPRETPEENKRPESHIAAQPVITPTGRHATLDRRRALNRRIRILLFRPRIETNALQNGSQRDRTIPRTEQNQLSTNTSIEASPPCSRADITQNQQSSSTETSPPCSRADITQNQQSSSQPAGNLIRGAYVCGSSFQEIENAKVQLIPFVKKSIKDVCAQSPLDQSAFTNVARRATNTILALCGIAHNRDRVVDTPYPFPSNCCHACDGREPAFLMRTICSSCFNSFVGDVVSHIANLFC